MKISFKLVLVSLGLFFSLNSFSNTDHQGLVRSENQNIFYFLKLSKHAIRVSQNEIYKYYEFCEFGKCVEIGRLPNLEFSLDNPRFNSEEAGYPEHLGGSVLGVISFGISLAIVVKMKMSLNKFKGPGSQSSPNNNIISDLIFGALGIGFGVEAGKAAHMQFIEWTTGDDISVYESESIARTLVPLDSYLRSSNNIHRLDVDPYFFRSELKLAISAVNKLLKK